MATSTATITGRAQEVFNEVVSNFSGSLVTAKNVADKLDLNQKTVSKYLNKFAALKLISKVSRGLFSIPSNEANAAEETEANAAEDTESNANEATESNATAANTESNANEATEANTDTDTDTDTEANDGTSEYDLYINGAYVSTLRGTVSSLTATIRVANPGVILESQSGRILKFVEQAGTKG